MSAAQGRGEGVRTQSRSRAETWGEPADRAQMEKIAEDVARRSAFRVCAIEVLRADRMLEFVAIVGSPEGSEQLLGQASPLSAMMPAFQCGAQFGSLTFVAAEWLTGEVRDLIEQYGFVPDLPEQDDASAWDAHDMLIARMTDDDGELRAVLYLDEPLDGRRRRPDELLALSDDLQLAFRAVLTTVERESLAQQARLAQVTREMVRSASYQLGLEELMELARTQLARGFRADRLELHVIGDEGWEAAWHASVASPDLLDAILATLERAWSAQRVVIIEPGNVWGDEQLHAEHVQELSVGMERNGWSTMVLVPFGGGGELFGSLLIMRGVDGPRWTESESAAALDVGRDLAGAVLNARSFERKQKLNAELRRLDDYRTELISTMSHELKNPIGAILGHLEILEGRDDVPPDVRGSFAAMARAAHRLEGLAGNLLTLSRLGNPDHRLRPIPVDLHATLTEAVELVAVGAEQQRVAIEVADPVGDVMVPGDPDELLRVFANLVSNAVKYSDPGGTVRLGVSRLGETVEFVCADEGLGISAEDQAHLFTEFFRSSNVEALHRPGTGLGLAIVEKVVQRHRGTIEVDSTLGVGTTFRVSLPG